MKRNLVIADSGVIFSLAVIDSLHILDNLFVDIKIPRAVWNEITLKQKTNHYNKIRNYFKNRVVDISVSNNLRTIMDKGESEAVVLYQELKASYLLIDDKKAREKAESMGVNCIGTLGLLTTAKNEGYIDILRPLFVLLIKNDRYYSLKLLNKILQIQNEEKIV